MNRRRLIWQELLVLSKSHLKLLAEEEWKEWEEVSHQKEELYKELGLLETGAVDREEKDIRDEIQTLEEQAKAELMRKRDETKQELIKISQGKIKIKNYSRVNRKAPERHFSIKG
jgi:hypothetical protein